MHLGYFLYLFLLESSFLGVTGQNFPNPACSYQDPSGYAISWGLDQQQNVEFYMSFPNFPMNGGYWTGIGFGSTNQLNAIMVETQNGQVVVSPARILPDLPPQRNSPLMNADGLLNGNNLQTSFSMPLQFIMSLADGSGCVQFSFFTNPTRSDSTWNGQVITRMICNLMQCIQRLPYGRSFSQYGNNLPYMNQPMQNPNYYYNQQYPSNTGYSRPQYQTQNYGYNYNPNQGYFPYGYNTNDNTPSDFVIENPNYRFLPNYLNDQYERNYQMQQSQGFGNFMNGQQNYGFTSPPIMNNDQQNQLNYQDILQRSNYYGNGYNNPQMNTPYNMNPQYMNPQYMNQPYSFNPSMGYGRKKRKVSTLENLLRVDKRQSPEQSIYYPYRTETNFTTTNNANRVLVGSNSTPDKNDNRVSQLPNGRKCTGNDPEWCSDYVANFMEWKTKHESESAHTTLATCKALIESLENSHHHCCQAVRAAGCYII